MLLRILTNLGARVVMATAVAAMPLLTWTANASAGVKAPAAQRSQPRLAPAARISNPSANAPRAFQPSGRRPATLSAVMPAQPLVNGPGTGPQLLQDPGFEFGTGNPYWTESSSGGFLVISPSNPHSGRYSVDLCAYPNDTPACLDSASQQLNFNVPTGIISAELGYWFWVGSQEPAGSCTDYATMGIFDSTFTADPPNAATYCSGDWGDQQWHHDTINVTTYLQGHVGQRLTVLAQGIDDANAKSSEFFVDDMSLSIYTAPGAPSGVLAQPDNSAATISWQAPADGGAPITSYTITPYTNNGATAGTPVIFNSPSSIEVVNGLLNGTAYSFSVVATNAYATGAASTKSNQMTPDRSYGNEVASTAQYVLQNSNGATWSVMDPDYLTASLTPAADSLAIVNANVDLWTANAGINQDIGIAVSGGTGAGTTYPTVAGQPEAWKESGGFAGTFSPNAAAVQAVVALKATATYTFKLVWKTNRPGSGTSIFAAGGPIGAAFSPTRMTITVVPAFGTPLASPFLKSAASGQQYTLSGSNGSTWTDLGPTSGPSISFVAPEDGVALISGNADLWTNVAGLNQDLGIAVQGGAYPTTAGQPETWKESGGFAGTFSPNAAFLQGSIQLVKGTTYNLKLQWKANRPAGGGTIVAGAGPIGAAYSPTRLSIWVIPTGGVKRDAVSRLQYVLSNNDGSTWADMDATNLKLVIAPTSNCVATLSANADLWTANAGINQDLGIQVSSTLGTYIADRVGWKESGGFAGTFSPNAAFLQTRFPMSAGTSYTVKLQWKANLNAGGASIYAGAGPIGAQYSPTRLTAELACPGAASDRFTTTAQTVTAGVVSGPVTVELVDSYGNPAPAGPAGQTFVLTASGSAQTLDANGVPTSTLTIAAGSSSGSFKFKDQVAEGVTIQVQATGFTSLSQTETVTAAATSKLKLTAPSNATRGSPFNVTVTAQDQYGNTTRGYTGTIHFTSSDGAAALPANYTFAGSDNGVHTFSVTLNTTGAQTVTATDTPNSQITGSSGTITIS